MGIKNGNNFFCKDYPRCWSSVESVWNFYRANGAAVDGLADRNVHKRKVVGERKVSVGGIHGPKLRGAIANSPKYVLAEWSFEVVSEEKTQHHLVFPWHNYFLLLENSYCKVMG